MIRGWKDRIKGLDLEAMSAGRFVELAYRFILRRAPDPGGRKSYLDLLSRGAMTRQEMLNNLRESQEFADLAARDLISSLHESRKRWILSLPRAGRILDLGGAAKGAPGGALLAMGYPYAFQELVIVDLPLAERHQLSREGYEQVDTYQHPQGPVRYVYTSLGDLGSFGGASFDLVHSGQSIEHVTREEGERCLREAHRVLAPGGHFCLDTPNRAATRLQSEQYLHPDHKHEYTHPELSGMLKRAGFAVLEAKGLNYLPRSLAGDLFDAAEAAANLGVYDDIEGCYLLAYRCRKA